MMLSFLLTLALSSASPAPTPSASPLCFRPLASVTIVAPRARVLVEVATTEHERETGLMNRRAMPEHHGMIFVFENDGPVEFWMKNTFIPLDMVFIAKDGVVRHVDADVPAVAADTPDDTIPRRSGTAKYVIELNSGEAARDGIVRGAKLRPFPLPAIQRAPGNLICM